MNNLADYLNDHLGGSVGALELLDHLSGKLKNENADLAAFLRTLRREIEADQDALKELLGRIAHESVLRKALGWLGEKVGRIKLATDGVGEGEPGLLESLEILALGITGKRLLWSALRAAEVAAARSLDLPGLERRAEEQFRQVEEWRLKTARMALAG
ncbi:MAG TPA: hypothetical protein VG796_24045 [Verrucomicrobiales bacterium]|nr:hypothetical protein [Verrucomicrobiales bacterium]